MIPGYAYQDQFNNPHVPRLDAGGLAYRPSGIYSMQDLRGRQHKDRERDLDDKGKIRQAYARYLLENAFKKEGSVSPMTLHQSLSGQTPNN